MKKILPFILSAVMLTGALAGCGNNGEANSAPESETVRDGSAVTDAETTEKPENSSSVSAAATEAPKAAISPDDLIIKPADWQNIQWQPYSNQYFTLRIPAGWNVQWQGDANQLYWMATSPDNTVGFSNLDHAYAAKDPNMTQTLGFNISMTQGTVQEYFENVFADSTEYFTVQNSCVPDNKDVLQAARPYSPIRDYQSLYATFKDENVEGEGIYTAVVMDSKDVVIRGANYGAWEINCIFTQWAPQGRLVDWAPVLSNIAKSFNYTDYYIQEWRQIAQQATATPTSINDTDPVMEAFEERSKSDTIIQEKRSDMLTERERVQDTETGEIYRAYLGFLDDMGDQSRYVPINDNQYADGYTGWIDKD